MKTIATFVTIAAISFLAPSCHAAFIAGVTIENVSSNQASNQDADNVINGVGFNETSGFHTTDSISKMWLGGERVDTPDPDFPNITFDLGANYDLGSLKFWNYNGPEASNLTNRGVASMEISVASSDTSPVFVSLGNFNTTIAPWSDSVDFGQVIDLSGFSAAADVRLVRFDVLSNHGSQSYTGFSEVRFAENLEVVPEPGALALIVLGGLCLLGAVSRRRS